MKFDFDSSYIVDVPEFLGPEQPHLHLGFAERWTRLVHSIPCAFKECPRRRYRFRSNEQIDIFAVAKADIAIGQHSKRDALHERNRQISFGKQALKSHCFSK